MTIEEKMKVIEEYEKAIERDESQRSKTRQRTYKIIRLTAMILLTVCSFGTVLIFNFLMEDTWEGFKKFYWNNDK